MSLLILSEGWQELKNFQGAEVDQHPLAEASPYLEAGPRAVTADRVVAADLLDA